MGWLVLACVVLSVFLAANAVLGRCLGGAAARREARVRMRRLAEEGMGPGARTLLRADADAGAGLVERLAAAADIPALARKAGMPRSGGRILAAVGALGLGGAFLGWLFLGGPAALLGTLCGAAAPYLWLKGRVRARMERFQRQLPEALDLVGRALRAGHGFSGALRMIADECDDPIGPEFAQTLDEINYGLSVDEAMQNLLARVDCPDLKFFVVSVGIQRESGGNLTEIVGNIASLIRERYKLAGKIKTLSAEGRLSALVLILLPFGVGLIIYLLNPDYMSVLWQKDAGRMGLAAAGVSMLKGVFWIRRMVAIRV